MTPEETALILARAQFAFTVSFHFIFPAFSIGLASYLAVLEGLWLATGRRVFIDLFRYWIKIFAVAFAMGVVSGIVMSYQFGTNWSVFSDRAGPIIGPLMAYEVLTAFFLEAGFLGVMLFGTEKVGRGLHFAATLCVAVGTFVSAFWILSVNSWMHTPVGFTTNAAGQYVVAKGWWEVVWNPSFPYRLVHTVIAAYLTTALAVGGVGAWHLLKGRGKADGAPSPHRGEGQGATEPSVAPGPSPNQFRVNLAPRGSGHAGGMTDPELPKGERAFSPEGVRTMFSMAMWMAAIVAPIQIFAGDEHGLNTLEHQPAKVMAMEGHYRSHPEGAPLILFGIPDDEQGVMRWPVEIPKLSSLILKHDLNAPLAGLETVPEADRPPVAIIFWSFRVMVGLGFLMLGLGLWSLLARLRGRLYDWRWLHRFALAMGPAGFVAVIAGWITTEVGRQPWVIYGVMRTKDAVSPIATPGVAGSLIAFVIVYGAVFSAGGWYILKMMAKPPERGEDDDVPGPVRTSGITPAHGVAEQGTAT